FPELIDTQNPQAQDSRPYPFYLAHAFEDEFEALGPANDWSVEHKWDGIRSQTILRGGKIYVWSRGEELVTDKYPEFSAFVGRIPDGTVIDGEILPFIDGQIANFNSLQTRIGRKNLTASLLKN